jgi:hypothetical protein
VVKIKISAYIFHIEAKTERALGDSTKGETV